MYVNKEKYGHFNFAIELNTTDGLHTATKYLKRTIWIYFI